MKSTSFTFFFQPSENVKRWTHKIYQKYKLFNDQVDIEYVPFLDFQISEPSTVNKVNHNFTTKYKNSELVMLQNVKHSNADTTTGLGRKLV